MRGFTIAQVMGTIRLALKNARKTRDIRVRIRSYGYGDERMNEGEALYREAEAERFAYNVKRDNAFRAHENWKIKSSEAKEAYIQNLNFARKVMDDCRHLWHSLEMKGRRKYSFLGWTSQARRFYEGILSDEALSARMLHYNVTVEDLQAGMALIEEAVSCHERLVYLQAQSKQARVEWEKCLNGLKKWYYTFRLILRLALKSVPALFTAVGLSSKRKARENVVFPQHNLPPALPAPPIARQLVTCDVLGIRSHYEFTNLGGEFLH